jgi:hypothetical protein
MFARELTVKVEPIPVLPVTLRVPVTPVLVRDETPITFKDPKLAAEEVVNDPPTPALPLVVKVEVLTPPDKDEIPLT